jgi:ankyrin repeat protein
MNPLHYAIESGNFDAFIILVDCYPDINVTDSSGMTPLHYAVLNDNEEIVKELIKRGADVTIKDNEGTTARDNANGAIKKLFD